MRALFGLVLAACMVVGACMPWTASQAEAAPPPDRLALLQHGINLTGWFRFPAAMTRESLQNWIGDDALTALHKVGFGFVRLPVDPVILAAPDGPGALVQAIRRIHKAELAVVVSVHPNGWHLETEPADRERLSATWRRLGPLLQSLDQRRTLAELLNEPVFPRDPAGWQALQHRLLTEVRSMLPANTIVLTGNDWGSVDGLAHMTPEPDRNVIYSVHLYDPVELTSLAAWRAGLNRSALARLPFPVTDEAACAATALGSDPDTAGVIRFYCAQHWDSGKVADKIAAASRWSAEHATPVLLGEFGASSALNPLARLAWLGTVRQEAERARIGWALWGYDDVMGLNVPRPPGNHPALPPAILTTLGLHP